MPRRISLFLIAWLAGIAWAEPPPEAAALQKAVHKLIDGAEPSIACILVSRSDKYAELGDGPTAAKAGRLGEFNRDRHLRPFGDGAKREMVKRLDLANPETVPETFGSGVVIDDRGLILTNFHVIENATKIYVRLPGVGRGSYADIQAGDARSDLAVLKMIRPTADLKAIPFGDGGKVRKGDWVISLANPFAVGFRDGSPSASWGIVSNVRRQGPGPGPTDEVKRAKPLIQHATLLQTDARLNFGCSGGALLNFEGELVGLTTSLAARAGGETAGGYAIPIDVNVKKMIEVLKRGEEIEYGYLGVTVNTTDVPSDGQGVAIGGVADGQPAARAGIRARDKVVAINGNPVRENDDLFLHIAAALAGTDADIQVMRNNTIHTFKVRLAKSSSGEWGDRVIASNRPKPVFGLRVDYSSMLPSDTNPPEGVWIREIESGSDAEKKKELKEWADRAKLIVLAVDGTPVPTPSEFYRVTAGKTSVTLDVIEAIRESGTTRRRIVLP